MGYLVTVVPAMLLGFLAGLWSFRVKSRWCSQCGAVKSCPDCAGWATHPSTDWRIHHEQYRQRPGT
jgi:hypothetical protein